VNLNIIVVVINPLPCRCGQCWRYVSQPFSQFVPYRTLAGDCSVGWWTTFVRLSPSSRVFFQPVNSLLEHFRSLDQAVQRLPSLRICHAALPSLVVFWQHVIYDIQIDSNVAQYSLISRSVSHPCLHVCFLLLFRFIPVGLCLHWFTCPSLCCHILHFSLAQCLSSSHCPSWSISHVTCGGPRL